MEVARIRVATCHDRAQAIAIREELEAHGIDAVVSSESHAPPGLEGLASGFQSFEVWVAEPDGERALGLLGDDGDDEPEPTDDEPERESAGEAVRSLERRKRTGVALLLSLAVTFGTGHLYTRAWMRGAALAALEIVGFGQLALHPPLAAALIVSAIVADAVGSSLRIRVATRPVARLPAARVVR